MTLSVPSSVSRTLAKALCGVAALVLSGSAFGGFDERRVTTTFTGSVSTVSGTPFGLSSGDLGGVVTGSFRYDPTTPDTNSDPARGDYQQTDGRLTINLPNGSKISGSFTPFLQVEDFTAGSDTFRYLDGPRAVGNGGGTMALNDVLDTGIQFTLAISGPVSTFSDDSLPDPLPYSTGSIPPHTFSLSDGSGGTVLIQLSQMTSMTAGVTVTESDGSTEVTEGGATDTLDVALSATPSSDVVVTLIPESDDIDIGQGPGNAINLTFTPGNASTAQPVTVSAFDDDTVEGSESVSVRIEMESFDPFFDGILFADFTVDVTDNDSGGKKVTETDAWSVWYDTANQSYSYYAALGDLNLALAVYYYYLGLGDYYFYNAAGNAAVANFQYYNYTGLYYLYAFGSSDFGYYYYYLYLAYAYYYYFVLVGDLTSADLYFTYLFSLAVGT